MHLEKIRLDKIQNGRLSAIIHFHMAVIWSTVLDGQTIKCKTKCEISDEDAS